MNKNKALGTKYKVFLLFSVMCLVLFNIGCGLDTFYYMEAPYQNGNKPDITNVEPASKAFTFETREKLSTSGFVISGTEVFYKIYSDKSKFQAEKEVLLKMQDDEDINASDKLIGTSGYGYGYKALRVSGSSENTLIPFSGSNKFVEIRLTDYFEVYPATLKVDGKIVGVPLRFNGKSFNFGQKSGKYIPNISDDDVAGSVVPDDKKWYVCLFAVSKGRDAAYTNYYSNICYLGSVVIDSSNENN